jgi:hypothetical protein
MVDDVNVRGGVILLVAYNVSIILDTKLCGIANELDCRKD